MELAAQRPEIMSSVDFPHHGFVAVFNTFSCLYRFMHMSAQYVGYISYHSRVTGIYLIVHSGGMYGPTRFRQLYSARAK